jgi:hypothetical protein
MSTARAAAAAIPSSSPSGTASGTAFATALVTQEAEALLVRLDRLRPFVMTETMVLAAALPYPAHRAVERFLHVGRTALRGEVEGFLDWLAGPGAAAPAWEQQRRFVAIRMHFNDVLSQLDVFAEVVTQRSEQGTGVWLSGLDRLAADAVQLPGSPVEPPPLVCYLARGAGAAIRRARTRLPGGRLSPVAIIRVPRERMVGHGVASSLIHEVGHQVAAQLELVPSLQDAVRRRRSRAGPQEQAAWDGWHTTVSECVADLWSVGKLGISSTLGLLAVVSLPRALTFRPPHGDPHPMPYVRVLLSAAIGRAFYPHPQWDALVEAWKACYPVRDVPPALRADIARLEGTADAFAGLMAEHRPPALGGRAIADVLPLATRTPPRLLALRHAWGDDLGLLARRPPTLVFAVMGQARAAGLVPAHQESAVLADVLAAWAVRSSIDVMSRPHPDPPRPAAPVATSAQP